MALIKCESCGQMISDRAVKCPKCGAPLAKKGENIPPQDSYTNNVPKSGSNNTLDLRGTYNDNTRTLFLREYLEDGASHAYMELKKSTYNNDFYGTFTRHNGAKMSINMTKIN